MMWVLDGWRNFGGSSLEQIRNGPMAERARRCGIKLPRLDEIAPGAALTARVNHNRWIADCPDCSGAEYIWLTEPLFMCQSCWNSTVDGRWRRVMLPRNVREIEAELEKRPIPQTRNWEMYETITDLQKENAVHLQQEVE